MSAVATETSSLFGWTHCPAMGWLCSKVNNCLALFFILILLWHMVCTIQRSLDWLI